MATKQKEIELKSQEDHWQADRQFELQKLKLLQDQK
jgi:hypothetical protein